MKQICFLLSLFMILLSACTGKRGIDSMNTAVHDTILVESIFPYQDQHCHGSSIAELPDGNLLAAWFQGSGERTAEDVAIMGARFNRKTGRWSSPFILADVEGFPDINPVLFIDGRSRLWLVWYTVLAYQWESSLIKYRISDNYLQQDKPPVWTWQDVLHVKADGSTPEGIGKNDPFVITLQRKYNDYYNSLASKGQIKAEGAGSITLEMWNAAVARYFDIAKGSTFMRDGTEVNEAGERIRTQLGYPLMRRIGWQTRNKPLITGSRILLPLYSDGFDFSMIAISQNNGESWSFSEPIVGAGSIQPALLTCNDSSIKAYMRDNGPSPKRLMKSTSYDQGRTWSVVEDTEIPNPGSAADMAELKSGSWVIVSNDLDEGRHRLTVMLSKDEGKTWPYRKTIINGMPGSQTRAHYPAIIQTTDGLVHVTFTNQIPAGGGKSNVKNIAHAVFSEKWLTD
jgi:predicted neuraminidase